MSPISAQFPSRRSINSKRGPSRTLSETKLDPIFSARHEDFFCAQTFEVSPLHPLYTSTLLAFLTEREERDLRGKEAWKRLFAPLSPTLFLLPKAVFSSLSLYSQRLPLCVQKALLKNSPLFPFVLHSCPNCICLFGRVIRHFNRVFLRNNWKSDALRIFAD